MQRTLAFLIFLTGIALSGCSTLPDGRTIIDQCTNIVAPGSYVLTRNLTTTSDCLLISADHVTVDLNGFTISGANAGKGITTQDAIRKSIRIRNGNVINFHDGIELRNVRDTTIEGVHATDNVAYGIFAGINAPGGAHNIIKECIAIDNEGTDIVTTAALINNVVDEMVAANSVVSGNKFEYLDADHALVSNNHGDRLFVGNCPSLIIGNDLNHMAAGDPPPIFATDCKVINNIPAGLTSP